LSSHVPGDEHRSGRLLSPPFRSGICGGAIARHGLRVLRVCYVLPDRFRIASGPTCCCGVLRRPAVRAYRAVGGQAVLYVAHLDLKECRVAMYEQTGRYYAFFGPHATITPEEERFLAYW